ncbi:hypothetical protein QNH28_06295 [Paenibacillus sp. G2S3]|uniref:hypothetical protein n=1 Tax=Paenibacillus sp. G2S3 TaxID=3047872 RepID=UPI0024C1CA9D|nr:hypothetical protein [Paenibacillus sp. G2S3]WHY20600.1 hypothetical protein QNH28_06295 [Paenibacillus sp. G2S3]
MLIYAVIVTSERTDGDNQYAEMADEMLKLASVQPGFFGVESAREGVGITVSNWDLAYKTRVCKVERDYRFERV